MEENRCKLSVRHILPELGILVLVTAGIIGYGLWKTTDVENILRNVVVSALGILITGFLFRQDYIGNLLDYDNESHYGRFWIAVLCGVVIAFICVFLPTGGWPFVPVYVLLSLFSNMSVGVLSASVLLMISVLLGECSAGIFFLYFISGIFAASLFRGLKNGFTIGIPTFLSMLCLLVCETANIVLVSNERLELEQFLVPGANLIVSTILLVAILQFFSQRVVYKYRENYLELNDPENTILAEYKEEKRADYFVCVHTAYFCERIAARLGLDTEAVKCAGYYHKMESDFSKLLEENNFPPMAEMILKEYHTKKKAVTHKETAVLICSEAIINSVMYLISKNTDKALNYDQVIDMVFQKFQDTGTFIYCDITMQELNTMQKIFKEEKLYYDFLR